MSGIGIERATEIAAKVEAFVREVVIPYEHDPRLGGGSGGQGRHAAGAHAMTEPFAPAGRHAAPPPAGT